MSTIFTKPQTFWIGATSLDKDGLYAYLHNTNQLSFLAALEEAQQGDPPVSLTEALVSFYAKLCYASLTTDTNNNITKVRSIADNLFATMQSGHGSVFEHVWLNFVTTGCSRVFTHEMVRHRAGTAFSQTSGRYVRTDNLPFVMDPILEPIRSHLEPLLNHIEHAYNMLEMMLGLKPPDKTLLGSLYYAPLVRDMETKKKLTSALRRILPNGQANELGWSINIRQLRHWLMLRSSRHAEWEIRTVACQVFDMVRVRYPHFVRDALIRYDKDPDQHPGEDVLFEIGGMTLQPYDTQSPVFGMEVPR